MAQGLSWLGLLFAVLRHLLSLALQRDLCLPMGRGLCTWDGCRVRAINGNTVPGEGRSREHFMVSVARNFLCLLKLRGWLYV